MNRLLISIVITLSFGSILTAFADAPAQKPLPKTIPCVPSLPCITEETQKDAVKTREHVIGTFGTVFLTGFLGLMGLTSVVFIIVGGLQMHLALGNEEAIGKARKTITWAILGLVFSILSVAAVNIISKLNFE